MQVILWDNYEAVVLRFGLKTRSIIESTFWTGSQINALVLNFVFFCFVLFFFPLMISKQVSSWGSWIPSYKKFHIGNFEHDLIQTNHASFIKNNPTIPSLQDIHFQVDQLLGSQYFISSNHYVQNITKD